MSIGSWTVQTVSGHEWGYVKRLVLDPVTRRVSHADVVVARTGRLIRVPWESFEVWNGGIKLRIPEGLVTAQTPKPPVLRSKMNRSTDLRG